MGLHHAKYGCKCHIIQDAWITQSDLLDYSSRHFHLKPDIFSRQPMPPNVQSLVHLLPGVPLATRAAVAPLLQCSQSGMQMYSVCNSAVSTY